MKRLFVLVCLSITINAMAMNAPAGDTNITIEDSLRDSSWEEIQSADQLDLAGSDGETDDGSSLKLPGDNYDNDFFIPVIIHKMRLNSKYLFSERKEIDFPIVGSVIDDEEGKKVIVLNGADLDPLFEELKRAKTYFSKKEHEAICLEQIADGQKLERDSMTWAQRHPTLAMGTATTIGVLAVGAAWVGKNWWESRK